jgi:hypothetical protein
LCTESAAHNRSAHEWLDQWQIKLQPAVEYSSAGHIFNAPVNSMTYPRACLDFLKGGPASGGKKV